MNEQINEWMNEEALERIHESMKTCMKETKIYWHCIESIGLFFFAIQ